MVEALVSGLGDPEILKVIPQAKVNALAVRLEEEVNIHLTNPPQAFIRYQ